MEEPTGLLQSGRSSREKASLRSKRALLLEARTNDEGEDQAMTSTHVDTALNGVATTVFPHRALEIQKLWMNRRIFKPTELTTRQTAAAINRLNNALVPLFPLGTDTSKFLDTETWNGPYRQHGVPSSTWTDTFLRYTRGRS
jgi:hypothetical protein